MTNNASDAKGPTVAGNTRRAGILDALRASDKPLSGGALGKEFGVSRQIIVQDIALLRSQGVEIEATARGYVMSEPATQRLIKVRHSVEESADEMNAIVDLGGCIHDVIVNHRTYGVMRADLNVKSRRDVQRFVEEIEAGVSSPLSVVTSGYHFHHVSADSEEILDEIEAKLGAMGFLSPFTEYERETF